MPQLGIVRTTWAGTSGGPGLTQLAFREATSNADLTNAECQAAVNAVRAFWNGIFGLIANEVMLTVQPVVDIYDLITGDLVGSETVPSPPGNVAGGDTGNYSMASGMKLNLNTGVIRNGRRVRGAIYIVPAGASAYGNNGMIAGAAKTSVNSAAATMKSAFTTAGIELLVWSRPSSTTAGDGDVAEVSVMDCNEKSAILRGRRD